MRRLIVTAALTAFCAGAPTTGAIAQDGAGFTSPQGVADLKIDVNLQRAMDNAAEGDMVAALVYLDAQADIDGITREMNARRATMRERHETVVRALQGIADATQGPLLNALADLQQAGDVSTFQPFWIANLVAVEGTPGAIQAIAARPEVIRVYLDYPIEHIGHIVPEGQNQGAGPINGGPEIGVIAVRAPEVWEMGFTGEGVLVANIDTGVDGDHPALEDRWVGVADPRYQGHPEWAWFDPVTNTTFPRAFGSHGTHTMGTVCGGSPGRQVGVAPGAVWMASGVIDRESIPRTVQDAILSFQWMADPDGDPTTNFDVPAVCSNSWGVTTGHGFPPCDEIFWEWVDGSEAAGTVQLFSAGNEGNSGLRRPADRATNDYDSCAVAAVDARDPDWPIASFSSRGPTFCTPDGSAATKPDIAAPGVNVLSAVDGGGYAEFSGTSMASPHVNGVIALMRQANPNLPVDQLKQIVYDTAFDLGIDGEDNAYGWGMIDAVEAVNIALSLATISFEFPDGLPTEIDPAGGTRFRVEIIPQQADPAPGTGLLHVDDGSGFVAYPMEEISETMYDAVFPTTDCPTDVSFYVSVETTDGELVTSPFDAPANAYSAFSISEIIVHREDDFEEDGGWFVRNNDNDDGAWERGVPAGDGERGDPTEDFDGSGACFLTGNAAGNSDVDGGPTFLVSPLFDLSDSVDPYISYARWFHSQDGEPDQLIVELSDIAGGEYVVVEAVDHTEGWVEQRIRVKDYVDLTDRVRIRFGVRDTPNDSVTEAAIDAFAIRELVCAAPAELTGFEVLTGTLIAGDLADLTASDDNVVQTRSGFGASLAETHLSETLVNASSAVGSPSRVSVSVESRIDEPSGQVKIELRNWSTGEFERVAGGSVGTTDSVVSASNVDATNYVNGGAIDIVVKHVVFSPFLAFDFDAFVDEVSVEVQ